MYFIIYNSLIDTLKLDSRSDNFSEKNTNGYYLFYLFYWLNMVVSNSDAFISIIIGSYELKRTITRGFETFFLRYWKDVLACYIY